MFASHVIDIDGVFVGAAVQQRDGYRFVAVDPRVELLNGTICATLRETFSLARQFYISGRPQSYRQTVAQARTAPPIETGTYRALPLDAARETP